ncbi:hypothetical protein H6G94_25945 [Nostoc punctiforme FACHB-252]|uniref:SPOR domain-containing protein n=1 Tax=Nostoc punctiforme FACHB-252 TaxID=1357509 RepID=A0ABR8HI03_NOSPU|nr:hypothetical protein [Nostoc punctiforme]MBD2614675.1 hypothetical protein [Nostoc punctiforme FACHB-252]
MTENPLNNSGNQSPKTPGLKPALAAALASLEVPLDRELARYRRTRTGSVSSNQSRVGSYINSQPQQFTAVSTALGTTGISVAETKIDVPPLPPVSVPVNPQITPASSVVKIDESPIPAPPNPLVESEPVTVNTEIQGNVNHVQPSLDSGKKQTELPPPPPNFSTSIVPTVVKDTKDENLVQPDDGLKQPDDYLESSEALLRSLTEEQPQTKKPNTNNYGDSLLSPLGIGSMLLLLVASLTLGYVVFNPKSLPQWNLAKLFNSNPPAAPENTQPVASNVQSQIQPPTTSVPKYPNLAAEEFPEVRDPNDVVGLKPKAQTTPPVVTNPVIPQNPINPQPPLREAVTPLKPTSPIAIAPVPTAKPLPLASLSSTTPKPKTSPEPNAEIKPSTDGFYHVVIDNQGRALASAREIIPDAYLSPDKQLIFMGAFKTKEQVQRHIRLLESKGIKARVQ